MPADSLRVLFVTDAPDLASALGEFLALERIAMRHARHVGAALLALATDPYDVVLVDGSPRGTRERAIVSAVQDLAAAPPVVVLSDALLARGVTIPGTTVLSRTVDPTALAQWLWSVGAPAVR